MAQSIETFNKVFDGFLSSSDSNFFGDQPVSISFTIVSVGSLNPVTGERTDGTTDTYTAEGFRRDVKKEEFQSVNASDLVFTCKQLDLGYAPKINDKAVLNGIEYTVIETKDLGSVAWSIQLRE